MKLSIRLLANRQEALRPMTMIHRALQFFGPIAALVALWQVLTGTGIMPLYLISGPAEISAAFVARLADGSLLVHAGSSLLRLGAGLLLGVPLGATVAIATYMGRKRLGWLNAILNFIGQVPPVAWVPITIALAGIQDASKILLVAICTFFVIFASVQEGCFQISQKLSRLLLIYRHSFAYIAYKFYFRGSMPFLFNGLRLSVTIGWIVLISAELVGSSDGLGWFVWDSRNFGRSADMMVGVISLGILGTLLLAMIDKTASFAMSWKDSEPRQKGWAWPAEIFRN